MACFLLHRLHHRLEQLSTGTAFPLMNSRARMTSKLDKEGTGRLQQGPARPCSHLLMNGFLQGGVPSTPAAPVAQAGQPCYRQDERKRY